MRVVTRALGASLAALALAPAAHAGGPYMLVGAADDIVLQHDSAFAKSRMDLLKLAGLDTVRVTAQWARGQTELAANARIDLSNVIAAAKLDGVRVLLSVYPFGSSVTPIEPADRADFVRWVASIAQAYPNVRDFIVGNEPNLNRFWLPQFGPAGEDAAASAYTTLLAETYDAIKQLRPRSTVYGGALAPRGVDRPGTARDTHSPTAFILDMGAVYRASGRAVPVMDAFAFHPYADASNVPPGATHPNSTSIGIGDYDKLVALLGQAFDGTAQRGSSLPILYDEFGVESDIPAAKVALYSGAEATTVHPVDEATQAQFYNEALQLAFCQSTVMGLLLFHAVDEAARSGWQSGVYYVDGRPKSSIGLVRNAADAARRGILAQCPGMQLTPKLKVTAAVKPRLRVTVSSTLDASYSLRLQRLGGSGPNVTRAGSVPGRRPLTLPVAKLPPGRYRWLAQATAVQNAGPAGFAASNTFTVR